MILDTETAELQAWQEIYLEHGAELSPDRCADGPRPGVAGRDPCDQLESQLGELVDRDALRRRHRVRTAELIGGRSALPGVTDLIDSARRRRMLLAVASNSPRVWLEEHLRRLDLCSHFDVIRCADDVSCVKPAPELHLSVIRALEVAPEEGIAIEDSPDGIAAAKAAGLYCVSVPNALTRSLSMDAADLVLFSLATVTLDEIVERAGRHRRRAS